QRTYTLFPYTTLFRSEEDRESDEEQDASQNVAGSPAQRLGPDAPPGALAAWAVDSDLQLHDRSDQQVLKRMKKRDYEQIRFEARSEEHTSELQSRGHL